jgi:hypothetical protein
MLKADGLCGAVVYYDGQLLPMFQLYIDSLVEVCFTLITLSQVLTTTLE